MLVSITFLVNNTCNLHGREEITTSSPIFIFLFLSLVGWIVFTILYSSQWSLIERLIEFEKVARRDIYSLF